MQSYAPKLYVLDGHNPVPVPLTVWGKWFSTADRTVARDRVGKTNISTVFLGLDHNFGDGPPLLFETLVSDGKDYRITRYSTWEQAEAGHAWQLAIAKRSRKSST